jgi:hypothetical protein
MLFDPKYGHYLGRLEAQLGRSRGLTPELMSDLIAEAGVRFATSGNAARSRIQRLIESGAWTDAALALVELELPQWKLRRVIYEDGEWRCSLSRHPELPLDLDELADGSHEVLPLAILIAMLQARRDAALGTTAVLASPPARPVSDDAVCCDNFA